MPVGISNWCTESLEREGLWEDRPTVRGGRVVVKGSVISGYPLPLSGHFRLISAPTSSSIVLSAILSPETSKMWLNVAETLSLTQTGIFYGMIMKCKSFYLVKQILCSYKNQCCYLKIMNTLLLNLTLFKQLSTICCLKIYRLSESITVAERLEWFSLLVKYEFHDELLNLFPKNTLNFIILFINTKCRSRYYPCMTNKTIFIELNYKTNCSQMHIKVTKNWLVNKR